MHEASTERFICHLTTREDGVVQYYTKDHTQVAHLTTSMDDTHIEVWMHTRKRCADGRCKKPIAKFLWAEQAVEPEPDFVHLLEMIFGKGNVHTMGMEPPVKRPPTKGSSTETES